MIQEEGGEPVAFYNGNIFKFRREWPNDILEFSCLKPERLTKITRTEAANLCLFRIYVDANLYVTTEGQHVEH